LGGPFLFSRGVGFWGGCWLGGSPWLSTFCRGAFFVSGFFGDKNTKKQILGCVPPGPRGSFRLGFFFPFFFYFPLPTPTNPGLQKGGFHVRFFPKPPGGVCGAWVFSPQRVCFHWPRAVRGFFFFFWGGVGTPTAFPFPPPPPPLKVSQNQFFCGGGGLLGGDPVRSLLFFFGCWTSPPPPFFPLCPPPCPWSTGGPPLFCNYTRACGFWFGKTNLLSSSVF